MPSTSHHLPAGRVRRFFREGVSVTCQDGGSLRIERVPHAFVLRKVPRGIADTLLEMAAGHGLPETPDTPTAPASGERLAPSAVDTVLSRLEQLIEYRVADACGEEFFAVETMTRDAPHVPLVLTIGTALRLSRFAYQRRHGDHLVLESPRSPRRVRLLTPRAGALLAALGTAVTVRQLADAVGTSAAQAAHLAGHLAGAGLIDHAPDGLFPAESDTERQWSFHDLLFHSRSRLGGHDYPLGGTFPFTGTIAPTPALRASPAGPSIPLPRPDFDAVLAADPPLTGALEARRSLREPSGEPVDLAKLGEFLYRVGRVRAVTARTSEGSIPYPATSRPYPSGGATYDIEFWLTVRRCSGVEPGIYHYDPLAHRLVLVTADPADSLLLLGRAANATSGSTAPDVLITLTSRFQRLSWKYESMAYATTLKNVGVLYQTMYLVATAMKLAGCALGNGDSREAERVLGLDPLRESPVGEFILSAASPAVGSAYHADWEQANGYDWHLRSRELVERGNDDNR